MLANRYMRDERLGAKEVNRQGLKMEVIEYNNTHHIIVQFEDGTKVNAEWRAFENKTVVNPNYKIARDTGVKVDRTGEEKINNQGCIMKIIKYNHANDIVVQFDDNPKHTVNSSYRHFKNGVTQNPFYPSVFGVGIKGNECPCMNGNEKLKEYRVWEGIIERCTKDALEEKSKTYEDCKVGDDFIYYTNFYKWITSQENYEVWKNTPNFAVDKDILCKGNKIYTANKCCLVPNRINNLIKNNSKRRGNCLIGVYLNNNGEYVSQCWNGLLQKNICLGNYSNEIDAYLAYKEYKEKLIKKTADIEYENGIISKQCRDALYKYEVEITD